MATATEGGHAEALAAAVLDQGGNLTEFHDYSQYPHVFVETPSSMLSCWSSVSSLHLLFRPGQSCDVLAMSEALGYAVVPEPVTMACVLAGVGSLGLYVRKRLRR
jgi:hypothetical protein